MTEDTISSVKQKETKKKDRKYTVYIHRNKLNNHAYIGKTHDIKERWQGNGERYKSKNKDEKYSQPVFANALDTYTWDGFEHIIFAEDLTYEEACHMEMLLIAIFKTNICRYRNPHYGYNMTDGGEGIVGFVMSDEQKKHLSELKKNMSDEYRMKISIGTQKAMQDPNLRKYLSDIKQGVYDGEKNPMFGRHHTEETKKKQSEIAIARNMTGDRNPNYGNHKLTGVNNPRARKTIRLSDLKVYDCLKEMAEENNINRLTMTSRCKRHDGFMYYDEYLELQKQNELKGE